MRAFLCSSAISLALYLSIASAAADEMTPVGRWHAFDDKTGKETGIIEITPVGSTLEGKIVTHVPQPDDPPNPTCDKCAGPDKGKPFLGLVIIKGFKKDGGNWDDGTILDPRSGGVYNAEIHVSNDGRELFLRGYIGISLLGHTVTWIRAE